MFCGPTLNLRFLSVRKRKFLIFRRNPIPDLFHELNPLVETKAVDFFPEMLAHIMNSNANVSIKIREPWDSGS